MKQLSKEEQEEAVRDAKIMQRHYELLIKQCDTLLSAEEGLKNLTKRIKQKPCKK
jgi:hypothetical protein